MADAVLAQAGSENFPVASRLLPRSVRADLLAVYGFARLVDDVGDEVDGDRLGMLDWLEEDLERAATGRANHPVMQQLSPTLSGSDLPLQPFRDLIEANRQDQQVHRYRTFDDLVGYCMLSAAPVGRIVLGIFGAGGEGRVALSDDICVGLQVVEHLQDVAEDVAVDRVYLPLDDLADEGCDVRALHAGRATPALRRVVARQARRARLLLTSGAPLAASLAPRARVAVAGFTGGGLAALDAIEAADFDVLGVRCRPRPSRVVARLLGTLAGSLRRGGRAGNMPGPVIEPGWATKVGAAS